MLGAVMVDCLMPLKIVYLLVRRVLGLAVLVFCADLAVEAELLVFRHGNAVLRRHASPGTLRVGRPGLARRAGSAHTA
jgi:hypothetical protein